MIYAFIRGEKGNFSCQEDDAGSEQLVVTLLTSFYLSIKLFLLPSISLCNTCLCI